MKDNTLKIVLADTITDYLWLGGGRVELKIGISVDEFMAYFGDRVIVGDISA